MAVTFAQDGPLRSDVRVFLETVAQMGALALERARLSETERQATEAAEQLQDRLKAEKQEESTRARNFFDNLTDGFIAYDREWRILYANEAAAALARLSPEDLVGKLLWDLFRKSRSRPMQRRVARS